MANESFKEIQQKYPRIREQLMSIPGVKKVAIGFKETNNVPTGETTITVFVEEKKDLTSLAPDEVIPKEIDGVKIDVIQQKKYQDEEPPEVNYDEDKYRPVQPGCYVTAEGTNGGTLGFIATLVSDSSTVLVSNHHVLYATPAVDATESGQPKISSSCCCRCNDISVNLHGIRNNHLDCAIARIKNGVDINDAILAIGPIRALENDITKLIPGTDVKKRGMATRYTEGKIHHLVLDATGTKINEIVVRKDNGNQRFSYPGDSGSALLTHDDKLIGLHKSGTNGDTVAVGDFESVAVGIQEVLDAFNRDGFQITVRTHSSDEAKPGTYTVRNAVPGGNTFERLPVIHQLEEDLADSPYGKEILAAIHRHREEAALLINHRRPVTVVWHRHQGPAFLAHVMNSVREVDYKIPGEVKGIPMQKLMLKMIEVFRIHGSQSFKKDIEKYGMDLLIHADQCESVHTLLRKIKETSSELSPVSSC